MGIEKKIKQITIYYENGDIEKIIFSDLKTYKREVFYND